MKMNDNKIHEMLEKAIRTNEFSSFDGRNTFDDDRTEYIFNMAKSLFYCWQKYKSSDEYKVDFECSLRNYLLLSKQTLEITGYNPSERFKDFGLQIDKSTGRVWATLTLPEFSNKELVKQLYMQEIEKHKEDQLHNLRTNYYVNNLTGFKHFKSNEQKLAVMGALRVPKGYSCLVSMTTGGGKSLITQTVAYQSEGLTIVIVPTVSLMIDQCKNAKDIIHSEVDNEIFYYHSECSLHRFYECLEYKTARLLFISPESLVKNKQLREKLQKANDEKYLKNIVVDEAHIIVEWGSSFRIDFQCLDALRKDFLRNNDELRTFLLSATYSDETIRQLKMFYGEDDKWIEIRCEKLRHETRFDIIKCNEVEKTRKVYEAIDLLPRPMIVYVKSPEAAEKLKIELNQRGYYNIHTFTGKTSNDQRLNLIEKWKDCQFDLMIATCAFGVGVDKKNVRTVLHTYIPENPNKYYQEAGRGGRDGLPCLSSVIYTDHDVDSAFKFVSKVITTEKLIGRWFSMLHSSHTQPLHNSQYMLDTYVKPDYNADEVYIDSISNQDVNWNVYVILFLRRNGLVSIDEIQYLNNKYVFYITVVERQLLSNNSTTFEMIDSIRDAEWSITEREFSLMKNNLNKAGKRCWSDMFTKIYRKVDDYCAGCNAHNDITDFEDTKTLKTNIERPLMKISEVLDTYMYGTRCMLTISVNYMFDLQSVIAKGINIVVASQEMIEQNDEIIGRGSENLLYCNYYDFVELIASNKYFISGVVGICIPDDVSLQNRIVNIIERCIKDYDIRFILFSPRDFIITSKNKRLSELSIVQHCKQD